MSDNAKTPEVEHIELDDVQLDAAVGGAGPRGLEPCLKTYIPCAKTYIPCIKVAKPG